MNPKLNLKKLFAWMLLLLCGTIAQSFAGYTYSNIDDPLGVNGTLPSGVDGNNIVGSYRDAQGIWHGFLYDGSTYTTLNHPLAAYGTNANAISGSKIAGNYTNFVGERVHGFLLSGTTWTTLDDPLAVEGTYAYGISGTNIVGGYYDGLGGHHGFLLSGTTYTTIDDPSGVNHSVALGVSGSNIVGAYLYQGAHYNGFIMSGTGYTTLIDPPAANKSYCDSYSNAISGSNIVGYYYNQHESVGVGYLLSGTVYSPVNVPQAASLTAPSGISSDGRIVGFYLNAKGVSHGFLATPVAALDEGQYTITLSSTDAAVGIPGGTGYGTIRVGPRGGVILAGILPDGQNFYAFGGLVSGTAGAQVLVYDTLRYPFPSILGARGVLAGTLTFQRLQGSDVTGILQWVKPPQHLGKYRSFFDTALKVTGSLYTPPAGGGSVLPGFTAGTVTLSDTTGVVASGNVLLGAGNKLSVPYAVGVSITPSTGVFRGAFHYPLTGQGSRLTEFAGVVSQDSGTGSGLFLGPNGSGTLTLVPQ